MQFGLPVITTRQGGIPDVVVDRINGAYIEPYDAAGLLAATDRLLQPATWRRISERNRAEALSLYGAERHCSQMIALLDEVCADSEDPRKDHS
jgi:glycosyltransferase involved in cell wall biosynthesis